MSLNTVMDYFKQISKIPRCSGSEHRVAEFLSYWAKKHNFDYKKDDANNVLITVPASEEHKNTPSVVLQAHTDMVCEKSSDSKHDFDKDPIDVIVGSEWVKANKTTLGADDGIGMAIAMALATQKDLKRPALELLFTADEERGMVGASKLQKGFFSSRRLINIDSETEGVITIGSAGGQDTDITMLIERHAKEGNFYKVTISGLLGGHSGIEIAKKRANAIKLFAEFMDTLKEMDVDIVSIEGGSARNAIASNLKAVIRTSEKLTPQPVVAFYKHVLENYPEEKNVRLNIDEMPDKYSSISNTEQLVALLKALPHGVIEMFDQETPKTSSNLAKITTSSNSVSIFTNHRSLNDDDLDRITQQVENIATKFGCSVKSHNRYPSWEPNYDSELVKKATEIYRKVHSKEPQVKVIHAGLECGVIKDRIGEIDMISVGPTIENAHTPQERLNIPSVVRLYSFLAALLEAL